MSTFIANWAHNNSLGLWGYKTNCVRVTIFLFADRVNEKFFFVNPKLKCHPNAQSRNVTYLRRMQSSPRRSRASIEFSVKSKSRQGCVIGTVPRFCFGRAAARAAAG